MFIHLPLIKFSQQQVAEEQFICQEKNHLPKIARELIADSKRKEAVSRQEEEGRGGRQMVE
jgi:hypothetical protein